MITPIIGSRIYNRNIAYNNTKNNDLSLYFNEWFGWTDKVGILSK